MGIKPASFLHEVTLLKKGLKKQKCMDFGLLQEKPCSSQSAIEQLLFGFIE